VAAVGRSSVCDLPWYDQSARAQADQFGSASSDCSYCAAHNVEIWLIKEQVEAAARR